MVFLFIQSCISRSEIHLDQKFHCKIRSGSHILVSKCVTWLWRWISAATFHLGLLFCNFSVISRYWCCVIFDTLLNMNFKVPLVILLLFLVCCLLRILHISVVFLQLEMVFLRVVTSLHGPLTQNFVLSLLFETTGSSEDWTLHSSRGSKGGIRHRPQPQPQPQPIETIISHNCKPSLFSDSNNRAPIIVLIQRASLNTRRLNLKGAIWNARSLTGKIGLLSSVLIDQKIDLMFLTDTWLKSPNDRLVSDLGTAVTGYTFHHQGLF